MYVNVGTYLSCIYVQSFLVNKKNNLKKKNKRKKKKTNQQRELQT